MNIKLGASLFCVALAFASCDNNTSEHMEDKIDTLAENVETRVDQMVDRDDNKEFVNDAVENNSKELYLLALGKQMGTSSEVRSAAQKMEADHKKLADEVTAYASAKGITIEADTTDTDHGMATRNKGTDWDKDWVDKMVKDHEKDVRMFEDARDDVDDPELKALIDKTLPTLRKHLDMAKAMQNKM